MKIALVHDYLSQDGGAERVLKAFHEIWPEAPIFVLFHDAKKITQFDKAKIHESFISKLPFAKIYYQWYLPLMPLATELHKLHKYDIVLSSTSAFAKGIITRPDTVHISYCHTPTRYLWNDTHEYIAELRYNKLVKAFLPRLIHKLRQWDQLSVDRVDLFLANSKTVQQRIQKYYRRDSEVIYPPADTEKFYISNNIAEHFVTGGRLVSYKRFDIVVEVFNRLKIPLIIFGEGPYRNDLEKRAKSNISFLGRVSDAQKAALLSRAKGFIHPQIEDCGITAIESMASGRPVIAYAKGGATETISEGKTGVFFHNQTWEDLLNTILYFDGSSWKPEVIQRHALQFSTANFKKKIKKYIEERFSNLKDQKNTRRQLVFEV